MRPNCTELDRNFNKKEISTTNVRLTNKPNRAYFGYRVSRGVPRPLGLVFLSLVFFSGCVWEGRGGGGVG